MFGFILIAVIAFVLFSAFKYYALTDAAKSTPERVFEAVKMGAVAVGGVVTAFIAQWTGG